MTHFIRSVSTSAKPSYKIGSSALRKKCVPKPGLGNEEKAGAWERGKAGTSFTGKI